MEERIYGDGEPVDINHTTFFSPPANQPSSRYSFSPLSPRPFRELFEEARVQSSLTNLQFISNGIVEFLEDLSSRCFSSDYCEHRFSLLSRSKRMEKKHGCRLIDNSFAR